MTERETQGLSDVIEYAVQQEKTEKAETDDEGAEIMQRFVSGVNCTPMTARDEMIAVKKRFGKEGGVVAYHGYQSFAPGEATPEIAHEIGLRLAKKLWGEKYQVLVATHLDKENHLHNHFVLNTVSFVDGIKFYRSEKDYYDKLHYNINHPNSAIEYFNCSNYRGNRGTCNETHYVRADSLEQVVLLELNRMVSYLQENEEEFAELLARKTSQDYEREKRFRQQKLAELNARYSEIDMLFERTYEDNVSGKLSDERFMKLSQRYDEEQQSLKKEIAELESICDKEDSRVYSKNQFLKAVRKFMQMKTLTPTMLHELVERIDVYHIQGTGKNRTQRLVIHYKFVGVLDLPHSPVLPGNVVLNSRQGVEIEYLVGKAG